jgi:hypothetical protein
MLENVIMWGAVVSSGGPVLSPTACSVKVLQGLLGDEAYLEFLVGSAGTLVFVCGLANQRGKE